MKKIVLLVVLILALIFLLAGSIFAFYGASKISGDLSKGSGSGFGSGCFLADQFFTDTSLADNPDQVISMLEAKYSRVKDVESQVKEVLSSGKAAGLNPVMALATWNGESSFRSDLLNSAFGYGNTDTHIVGGTQNWEAQVKGVYGALGKARDGVGLYADPSNSNAFTRFYYNYTTAMQKAYEQAGNQWVDGTSVTINGTTYDNPVGDRLSIIKLLEPGQLTCNSPALAGGSCPNVTQKLLTKSTISGRETGTPRVIIVHDTEDMHNIDQEYSFFNNNQGSGDTDVQYEVFRDGSIYQYVPDTTRVNGAKNYNDPTGDYGSGAISISIENEGVFLSSDNSLWETPAQVTADDNLIQCLMNKYGISKNNPTILSSNPHATLGTNVISHAEATLRAQVAGGHTDPGSRFLTKVLDGLK